MAPRRRRRGACDRGRDMGVGAAAGGGAARGRRRGRDGGIGVGRLRRGRGGGRGAGGAGGRPAAAASSTGSATPRPSRSGSPAAGGSGCWSSRSASGQGPAAELIERLAAARAARLPVIYAVRPEGWERRLVIGSGDPLWAAATAALVADRSGFAGEWFLGVHNPPLRMAVVGAVHIAQALVPMARLAGYDVTVIDPREAFATSARFPRHPAVAGVAGRGAGRASGSTGARRW